MSFCLVVGLELTFSTESSDTDPTSEWFISMIVIDKELAFILY